MTDARPAMVTDATDTISAAKLIEWIDKVLGYRPVDKGLAAKKTKRKLARKAKRDV